MKTDGYESDKNDIVVMDWVNKQKMNLTANWDETVDGGAGVFDEQGVAGGNHLLGGGIDLGGDILGEDVDEARTRGGGRRKRSISFGGIGHGAREKTR